ncbi:hypothetical protein BU23DRAFT_563564 [Bimuria novae-zelandiae CBS 107.79]|uniref:Rhodopsin domain-containing protein n=1 Tax=Bimuria novae-zelandiae CBS 107.79 TaxID=1447943 RepID=A0A6A5VPU4_9PLEO|nr:hypothetical protein BU23DRAFT_563564 [Bimuria novae-zelandiae CBS 107.79]
MCAQELLRHSQQDLWCSMFLSAISPSRRHIVQKFYAISRQSGTHQLSNLEGRNDNAKLRPGNDTHAFKGTLVTAEGRSATNGTTAIMPAPEGYVVDFDNPQVQYIVETYAIAAVEMTSALLFLIQRLYTKIALMKSFQLEDALVIVAWVFCLGTQICLFLGHSQGAFGRHAWEIRIEQYTYFSRLVLIATLLYLIGTAAAKCSLALFYRRLNPSKVFQGSVWFTLFVCLGAYISIFFSLLFACKPIAASWDPLLLPTAECLNRGSIYITQAVIGIVTDVLLLALPIPTLLKLQINTRKKIGPMGIFATGSITTVISVVRLIILMPALTTAGQSWLIGEGGMWIDVEANLLIMCCYLSTLRCFFKHVIPRLMGEQSSTCNSKSHSRGFSQNGAPRTFGSGGAKRALDSLMQTHNGDSGIPLSSLDDLGKDKGNTTTRVKSPSGDSDSEKAILFERTVQVTHEDRDDSDQDGRGAARGYEGAMSNQPKIWIDNGESHSSLKK